MNKKRFAIGPGAASLILMVVVVSMSVLGMLSLISARNDDNLTKRSMQMITQNYELNGKSERTLQLVDGERALAAADAADDTAYMEKLSAQLEAKYPGMFDVNVEDMTVSWTEYSDYGASDVVNAILFRVTGAEVGGRKCMNCCVRIAGLDEATGAAPVEWVTHMVSSSQIPE